MLMLDRKISAVPVLHGGQLVGLLTDTDLMKWLEELAITDRVIGGFLQRPAEELMRAFVMAVAPETPLVEVTDIFRRRRIRHVPVLEHDKLAGIVSDRDIRRSLGWSSIRELQSERSRKDTPGHLPRTAGDVMSSEVVTAERSTSLRDVLRQMLEHHFHSIPVVESRRLVGIVTQTDFLKAIVREELL